MPTKKIVLLFLLLIMLITASYMFIDRQLVWFLMANHSRKIGLLKIMANDITATIGIFVFLFYIFFAIRFHQNRIGTLDEKLLVMCNAIVISTFLKDAIKHICGRYATGTFICNNPSLVKDNVYGFDWFASGTAFSSFPSGHTTLIFSFSISMCLLFPTLRWLWSLLAIFVIIGQAGMYYHFISDILAGAALGSVVALCNYRYCSRTR